MLRTYCWHALNIANLFDAAVEVHQTSCNIEVRKSSMNAFGEPIQLPFVDPGFFLALLFVGVLWKVFSQQKLVGAAVTMVNDNHFMDAVECDRGVKMLPEGPAPIWIRSVINAQ